MATLAEQYRAQAIQWKVTNAAAEKTDAEAKINALAAAVQTAISTSGAIYIQVPNLGTTIPTYKAILTRFGKAYLESLGFRIEALSTHANIWWGVPAEVEKAVEDIINPPPPPIPDVPAAPAAPQAFAEDLTVKK